MSPTWSSGCRRPEPGRKAVLKENSRRFVVIGRIAGIYGVHGWLRIESYTADRREILGYQTWYLRPRQEPGQDWRGIELVTGRPHGAGIVAQLTGISDREQARAMIGSEIAVPRELLGEAGPNAYFWADLEGLRVVTSGGVELGMVSHLFATGANDVMVVRNGRERLIPFTAGVLQSVDLDRGVITVDWDPEF